MCLVEILDKAETNMKKNIIQSLKVLIYSFGMMFFTYKL